mgnify:FL=1
MVRVVSQWAIPYSGRILTRVIPMEHRCRYRVPLTRPAGSPSSREKKPGRKQSALRAPSPGVRRLCPSPALRAPSPGVRRLFPSSREKKPGRKQSALRAPSPGVRRLCPSPRLLFCVPQRIGIYVGWVDVKGFLIMPALRESTHQPGSQREKRLNHFACFFGGLAIAGCPYSKLFMTPTHPATTTYASAYLGHPLSLRGLSPSPRLLFCVPQRIGIYVGWVDVKDFLIMPALRKSTHHSKEFFGGLAIVGCPYSK